MSLISKIRKARETGVEAGGRNFTIRRPTDEEALGFVEKHSVFHIAKSFTISWDLKEIDLIPGGSPDPVPFDAELFGEWLADQTAIAVELANAVMQAYTAHTDKRDAAIKN